MARPFRAPGLTAAQQYRILRSANPFGGTGKLHPGALTWTYRGRPSVVGRLYTLELQYQQGEFPDVVVCNPDLSILANGKDLPHVYEQDPPRLCLFLPWTDEWTPQRTLVDTVMPWSVLWLYYFEVWLRSGEWTGGGMHPNGRAPRMSRESSRRNY